MLIDWFTVCAQALNFLVLVWLMKRYLYKPILSAIDAREKAVAAELAEAAERQAAATKERDEFLQKNEEFDAQRKALMNKATASAKSEVDRMIDDARKAADALRAARQQTLRAEHQSLNEEVTKRTTNEVFAIARKTLADLAATSLEERMADTFVIRLKAIKGKDLDGLKAAFASTSGSASLRSAFELPEAQQQKIVTALRVLLGAKEPVKFETSPDLICGIELSASGWKFAWSIADYLRSLEQGVAELVKGQPGPKSVSA